jgi:ADP-ribose pyrophosphatase
VARRWDVLNSENLVSNRWLTVRHDSCRTGKGQRTVDYYVVEKDDFAMAVALTTDDKLILVKQYKHGCGDIIRECPAGYLNPEEDAIEGVRRELREETGYAASEALPLGVFFSSPSFLNNRAHLFLCTGARLEGPQQLDANEDIEVELLDFAEAMSQLAAGTLELDMASALAVSLAWQRLSAEGAV